MILYLTILFIFLYFKIARVHRKEEKLTLFWKIQYSVVLLVVLFTGIYALNHISFYTLVFVCLFSFVMMGMVVTAVQLGIFVNGKPLLGMHMVYKHTIYLVLLLCFLSLSLWII